MFSSYFSSEEIIVKEMQLPSDYSTRFHSRRVV